MKTKTVNYEKIKTMNEILYEVLTTLNIVTEFYNWISLDLAFKTYCLIILQILYKYTYKSFEGN